MPASAKLTVEETFRPLCVRCLRAGSVCLCDSIRPFDTTFQVVLLQHPKERKNSIGTARFTHLTLKSSRLIAGAEFDSNEEVNAILDDPKNYPVTLFPGEAAANIALERDAFLTSIPEGRRLVIFVVDGTWSQARGMLRKSSRLLALPRVSFTIDIPSQYKVRKQPSEFCLSTVEAVARLVKLLDPAAPSESLILTFALMVDAQLECATRGRLREKEKRLQSAKAAPVQG
jgi:DTW domain-containing protein YfiP